MSSALKQMNVQNILIVLNVINAHTHMTEVPITNAYCLDKILPPSAQSLAEPMKCNILRSTLTSGSNQLIMLFILRVLSRRVRKDTARSRVTHGPFLLANLLFIKFDHLLKMTSQGQTRVRLHTHTDSFQTEAGVVLILSLMTAQCTLTKLRLLPPSPR